MNCPDARALASSYLDGELPEEMCDRIQAHMLGCERCRGEIGSLRATVDALRRACAPPAAGEEFVAAAAARIAAELEFHRKVPAVPGQLVLGIIERNWN